MVTQRLVHSATRLTSTQVESRKPSYMGIVKSHEIRIPELNHQDSMECPQGFFERCSFGKSSKSKFLLGFIPLGIQSYLVGGFNPFEKY